MILIVFVGNIKNTKKKNAVYRKKIIYKMLQYKVFRGYGRNVGREGKENARGMHEGIEKRILIRR